MDRCCVRGSCIAPGGASRADQGRRMGVEGTAAPGRAGAETRCTVAVDGRERVRRFSRCTDLGAVWSAPHRTDASRPKPGAVAARSVVVIGCAVRAFGATVAGLTDADRRSATACTSASRLDRARNRLWRARRTSAAPCAPLGNIGGPPLCRRICSTYMACRRSRLAEAVAGRARLRVALRDRTSGFVLARRRCRLLDGRELAVRPYSLCAASCRAAPLALPSSCGADRPEPHACRPCTAPCRIGLADCGLAAAY